MCDTSKQKGRILTVGHSTHSPEWFMALLKKHEVTALADVRTDPYSRYNPQFNKAEMERDLKANGIRYVFVGRELGARSKDPSVYVNGQVQYGLLGDTPLFLAGIDRLKHGLKKYRIALMCSEKDPKDCHRAILIAPVLKKHDIEVVHILADGSLESHEATMKRLPDKAGAAQEDLFESREALILARQEKRVAYTDREQMFNKRKIAK